MSIEQRLAELAIELPPAPAPAGNYVPAVQAGQLLFLSGVGPRRADGSLVTGKVGDDLDVDAGHAAARLTGLNMLAAIRAAIGSLDRIDRVVKTLGMVNCTPDFGQSPRVIDGFSDLFVELLGEERGRGARSAVGMAALPMQIAVEVEMVIAVLP